MPVDAATEASTGRIAPKICGDSCYCLRGRRPGGSRLYSTLEVLHGCVLLRYGSGGPVVIQLDTFETRQNFRILLSNNPE